MNDDDIIKLVDSLDNVVPRSGAIVRIEQYGDTCLESSIIANRVGYLRLGIEFLKAAEAPYVDKTGRNPFSIHVNLNGILQDSSDIYFHCFERREEFEEPKEYIPTDKDNERSGCQFICFALICTAIVVFCLIGLFTVIKWLI